ncbi:MAG TPA: M23 family metallopeptidase [Prochlorococcus sp.]
MGLSLCSRVLRSPVGAAGVKQTRSRFYNLSQRDSDRVLIRLPATAGLIALLLGLSVPLVSNSQRFDQSLEELERNRVITSSERRELEGSSMGRSINSDHLKKACSSGALSRQECATGVVLRSRARRGRTKFTLRRRGPGGQLLPPLTVPVSALLAGSGRGFSLASVFAVTPRPQPLQGNGDRQLLFPIIGGALTSSDFGMRLHPVIGSWLMHAGRDLAAPEGTPVVAALTGTVVSSGLAGGYGIAVEIEHDAPRRRTLYGHLSEIYLKPGQRVRQGEVIGRVGSTGLSTGPHLHFELRRPQGGGWVAIDPGELDLNPLTASGLDTVSLLVGQLIESLERN